MKRAGNTILNHAAWNWRMTRQSYLWLCAIFSVVQLCVLLWKAATADYFSKTFYDHYSDTKQILLFGLCYLLAGALALRPLWQQGGKAKAGYTFLTLPTPRWQLLAGHLVNCLVQQIGFLLLQVSLYLVYFYPVIAVSRWRQSQQMTESMPPEHLWTSMRMCPEISRLMPVGAEQRILLLITILSCAVCLVGVAANRRAGRLLAFAAGLFAAVLCESFLTLDFRWANFLIVVGIAFIEWLTAVRSLRRANCL